MCLFRPVITFLVSPVNDTHLHTRQWRLEVNLMSPFMLEAMSLGVTPSCVTGSLSLVYDQVLAYTQCSMQ